MQFKKLIKEIKGELESGDQITFPGSHEVWTVNGDNEEYFDIVNNTTGEKSKLSKFKLMDVKKVPIFEFKTQSEKDMEIERYTAKINAIKSKMKGFKANSRESEKYKQLKKELNRNCTALEVISKTTPTMTIY